MKLPIRMAAVVIGLAASAMAQDDRAAQMQANYDAKMKKDFVKNATWHTDWAKAKEQAGKEGKLIFAYFTRSYAP